MRAPEVRLVAEGVGESLHREARLDRESLEVERAVDLDEFHRAFVDREHRKCGMAQMLAADGQGVARDGWDGRRTVDACVAEAVHDVFRFDAWPHDDANLGEGGAHRGELDREGLLLRVEVCGAGDERVTLCMVRGVLFGGARRTPMPPRKLGRSDGHDDFPFPASFFTDSAVTGEADWGKVPLRRYRPGVTAMSQPVLKNLPTNLQHGLATRVPVSRARRGGAVIASDRFRARGLG